MKNGLLFTVNSGRKSMYTEVREKDLIHRDNSCAPKETGRATTRRSTQKGIIGSGEAQAKRRKQSE